MELLTRVSLSSFFLNVIKYIWNRVNAYMTWAQIFFFFPQLPQKSSTFTTAMINLLKNVFTYLIRSSNIDSKYLLQQFIICTASHQIFFSVRKSKLTWSADDDEEWKEGKKVKKIENWYVFISQMYLTVNWWTFLEFLSAINWLTLALILRRD